MSGQKEILLIPSTSKRYGGDLYEEEVVQALAPRHAIEAVSVIPTRARINRLLAVPEYLRNLYRIRERAPKVTIRSSANPFFLDTNTRNVVIAYHYDTRFCHPLVRIHAHVTFLSLLRQRKKVDRLVVISDYWADFFRKFGFKNIVTIRSAVNAEDFKISTEEIERFKEKYDLKNKRVVYIGNPLKKKGADKVIRALEGRGYTLVASGNRDIDLPILTLKLEFKEYVALLHSAGLVITFSQFDEGWCRVAHEAMLCGVPVIGSGLGGMRELLEAGGQAITQNADELPGLVDQIYGRADIGKLGRQGALKFPATDFSLQWNELIDGLIRE